MHELSLAAPVGQTLKVLALGAHSDDIEIGCGATLTRLLRARERVEVRWIVFSGDEVRKQEAWASAQELLAPAASRRVEIHGFRDGFFPYVGSEIKDHFETLKREFQPDLIFTHYRQDRHQDHRTISDLTWNTFRDHLILEYEIFKTDGDLGNPNLYVPIDEELAKLKTARLLTHFASQRNRHWFTDDVFLGLLRIRGVECGSGTRYAEAFYSRKVVLGEMS